MIKDFDHSFAALRPEGVEDGFGGETPGFVEEFTVRAHVRWMKGGEAVREARIRGEQPIELTIRRSQTTEAIRPTWRMQDQRTGSEYDVRSIVPSQDRMDLEITATLIS